MVAGRRVIKGRMEIHGWKFPGVEPSVRSLSPTPGKEGMKWLGIKRESYRWTVYKWLKAWEENMVSHSNGSACDGNGEKDAGKDGVTRWKMANDSTYTIHCAILPDAFTIYEQELPWRGFLLEEFIVTETVRGLPRCSHETPQNVCLNDSFHFKTWQPDTHRGITSRNSQASEQCANGMHDIDDQTREANIHEDNGN